MTGSFYGPGAGKSPANVAWTRPKPSGMVENVVAGPAGDVEPDPIGQKPEAGGRQLATPFAREHGLELVLERMQMQHVGRRIGKLGVGQRGGAPVRALLLLRHVDAQ